MNQSASDSYRNPLRYQGQDYSFAPRYVRTRDPLTPAYASTDIKPKENQGYYPLGSIWNNTANGNMWFLAAIKNNLANWVLLGTANGSLLTLSDDSNNTVEPSESNATPPDNIQLTGHIVEQTGVFSTVVANAGSHSIAINPMSSTRWIVDPLGTNGTHTTIQSAINSATAGDDILIMTNPNHYSENLTLKPGVNLTGFNGDNLTGQVVVNGNLSYNSNGAISLSNISFTIAVANNLLNCLPTGANVSTMTFNNCSFTAGGTASYFLINTSSVSAFSSVNFINCNFDLPNANAGYYANSGNGQISFQNSFLGNSGGSTVYSSCSAGVVNATNTQFSAPLQYSGSGAGTLDGCVLNTSAIPFTALDYSATTGAVGCKYCRILTGSANSVIVTSPSVLQFQYCDIYNTGTYAITGNGIVEYAPIAFTNTTFALNTTIVQSPTLIGPVLQLAPFSGTLPVQIMGGNGTPNGVVTAPIGSLFSRTDASSATTRLYINTNGMTAWTNITCAA